MSVAEPETLPAGCAVVRTPGLPPLRLLPVPSSEPPYDDELPAGAALRLVPPLRPADLVPVATPPPTPLRLVPAPVPLDEDDLPLRTPLAELPPSRPFAQALVQRLLEVASGLRPLSQLQPDTTLELFDELSDRLQGRPRPAGARPTPRDVRSLHVQERADGVAEVCATVRRGGRVGALALRLEGRSGAWRCSALAGL